MCTITKSTYKHNNFTFVQNKMVPKLLPGSLLYKYCTLKNAFGFL